MSFDLSTNPHWSTETKTSFAPGDRIVVYIGNAPCMGAVVECLSEEQIKIECDEWPCGFTAIVRAQEVKRG